MTGPKIYPSWQSLPGQACGRLLPLQTLLHRLFAAGMTMHVHDADVITVAPWIPDHWLGGRAFYYPPLRQLHMTAAVFRGEDPAYGRYRGDIHEIGHAVWYLLLNSWERWTKYARLHGVGKMLGLLIPYNQAAPNFEESWAQDFEAFWTRDGLGPTTASDWNRSEFRRVAPARYEFMAYTLRRLGAGVDETV